MRPLALPFAATTLARSFPASSELVVTEARGDTIAAGETLVCTLDRDRHVFEAVRSTTVLGATQGDKNVLGAE
ncbi:MAG: hypothetical protein AAGD43_07740 [Pseudomonadota bacterium]